MIMTLKWLFAALTLVLLPVASASAQSQDIPQPAGD